MKSALIWGSHLDTWQVWSALRLTQCGFKTTLATCLDRDDDADHIDCLKYIGQREQPFEIADIRGLRSDSRFDFHVLGLAGVASLFHAAALYPYAHANFGIVRRLPSTPSWWMKQWTKKPVRSLMRKIRFCVTEDRFSGLFPFSSLRNAGLAGVPVHQQFLAGGGGRLTSSIPPSGSRSIGFNIQGSLSSPFRASLALAISERYSDAIREPLVPATALIYDQCDPVPRERSMYIDTLDASWFTVCPPGMTVTTHRPVEAAFRGSIPILSRIEAEHHTVPFEHKQNCLLVACSESVSSWMQAIEVALSMPTEERAQISQAARESAEAALGTEFRFPALDRILRETLSNLREDA